VSEIISERRRRREGDAPVPAMDVHERPAEQPTELDVAVRHGAVGISGRRAARSTMEPLPSNRCAADLYGDKGYRFDP